jgi:hypothetical protein
VAPDGSQPYGGASDLSGEVWLDWDADSLYLSADLTDDVRTTWPN